MNRMVFNGLLVLAILIGSSQAAWNVTCDFDLDNIENIVEYLPIECQAIYAAGPTSELYSASVAESTKYQEFKNKLTEYESKNSPPIEEEVPTEDTALRFKIYDHVMLSNCSENLANTNDINQSDESKMKEFYDCLLQKREEMIGLIPK